MLFETFSIKTVAHPTVRVRSGECLSHSAGLSAPSLRCNIGGFLLGLGLKTEWVWPQILPSTGPPSLLRNIGDFCWAEDGVLPRLQSLKVELFDVILLAGDQLQTSHVESFDLFDRFFLLALQQIDYRRVSVHDN